MKKLKLKFTSTCCNRMGDNHRYYCYYPDYCCRTYPESVCALIYGNMVACVCCCCVACGNRAVRNDTDVLQGISCYRFLLLSVCCMCVPCHMPHTTLEKNRRASTISVHQLKRIYPPFPHYTHTHTHC